MQIRPIKTVEDNEAALARIEQLRNAEPNSPEGDELEVLATLVSVFEEENYPIEAPDQTLLRRLSFVWSNKA
jgi:HTH-type transcriptional regulator/antitoxin HigA